MSSNVSGNGGRGGGENLVMSPLRSSAAQSAMGCQPSCCHPGLLQHVLKPQFSQGMVGCHLSIVEGLVPPCSCDAWSSNG